MLGPLLAYHVPGRLKESTPAAAKYCGSDWMATPRRCSSCVRPVTPISGFDASSCRQAFMSTRQHTRRTHASTHRHTHASTHRHTHLHAHKHRQAHLYSHTHTHAHIHTGVQTYHLEADTNAVLGQAAQTLSVHLVGTRGIAGERTRYEHVKAGDLRPTTSHTPADGQHSSHTACHAHINTPQGPPTERTSGQLSPPRISTNFRRQHPAERSPAQGGNKGATG